MRGGGREIGTRTADPQRALDAYRDAAAHRLAHEIEGRVPVEADVHSAQFAQLTAHPLSCSLDEIQS